MKDGTLLFPKSICGRLHYPDNWTIEIHYQGKNYLCCPHQKQMESAHYSDSHKYKTVRVK